MGVNPNLYGGENPLAGIKWPELKLVQQPFRHYILMPQRIPIQWSVTSVVMGRSDSKHLTSWAARLAVEEYESSGDAAKAKKAHEESLAWSNAFGTLVHDCIEANLTGDPYMPGDRETDKRLTEEDVKKAAKAVASALTWLHNSRLRVVQVERKLAHSVTGPDGNVIWYAGTMDLLCVDRQGRFWIVDWKTASAIRTKNFVQEGGYAEALAALGIPVHGLVVVRLPRAGGVEIVSTTEVKAFRQIFLSELVLHQRYNGAKFHIKTCSGLEYVSIQEEGRQCSQCEAFCKYTTAINPKDELCVQCHANKIIETNESEKSE